MGIPVNGFPENTTPVLHVKRTESGDAAVYSCRGTLSLAATPQLDELMRSVLGDAAARVVLDLTEVKHCDSVGIGTLAKLLKHSMSSKRPLVVVPSRPVRDLLTRASLDSAFRLAASLDEALR